MVLQVETKNATFGSIIEENIKWHHLSVLEHSSLKVVFELLLVLYISKILIYPFKESELMSSALAYIKCQVIFYNTARDIM